MDPSALPFPSTGAREGGWERSAQAWIARQGERGDWGRVAVLDPVMSELASAAGGRFLDVGCGEGRFVRLLSARGLAGVGVDPVEALVATARERDPRGDYRIARGEALPFGAHEFALVVFYLSLCDIPDLPAAIGEAARVLRPGGTLLIANPSSINSAGQWQRSFLGRPLHYAVDDYMRERPVRLQWAGIDIVNYHRPFSRYFEVLLGHGFLLRRFLEPLVHASAAPKPKFDRVPNFVVMEWQKPSA